MSPALMFLLVSAASYRAARLVVDDDILNGPREWAYKRWPPHSPWTSMNRDGTLRDPRILPTRRPHLIGRLISCYWCVGFWLAGGVVAAVCAGHAWWGWPGCPAPLLAWPAASTLVGLAAGLG